MPDLIVQANRTAATLAAGQHAQHRAGWGDTFWQYRPAQPGEPAAHIDWRQSARSTHAYVRETEAESAQTILLWCDLSGSMNWQSRTNIPTKQESAILLTLAMAAALARGGERIRLLCASGMVHLPPGGSLLERLALALVFQASTPQKTLCQPQRLSLATLICFWPAICCVKQKHCVGCCTNAQRAACAPICSILQTRQNFPFPMKGVLNLRGWSMNHPLNCHMCRHYVQTIPTWQQHAAARLRTWPSALGMITSATLQIPQPHPPCWPCII